MAAMLNESQLSARAANRESQTSRTAVLLHTQPLMLEVIEGLLEDLEVETVSRHTTPKTALGAIGLHRPDAFILDFFGSDDNLDGVSSIREARALVPTIKAVAFADIADERQIATLLAAGAAVTVSRTARREEIASAVRQAFKPSMYVGHPIHLTFAPPSRETDPGGELTKREREILQLVAEGYSNDRVARHLWVTVQTVKFHLSNVYRKLDVTNRTEASRWAQRNGLLLDAQPGNCNQELSARPRTNMYQTASETLCSSGGSRGGRVAAQPAPSV